MKRTDKSAMAVKDLNELISVLSNDEILSEHEMQSVRGGDGDGGGDIILFPKPPAGGV